MKKLDNLEQFLIEQRAAFDTDLPSDSVWEKINQQLSESDMSIENFISKNRNDFDTALPFFDMWSKIENILPQNAPLEDFIKTNRLQFDTETPHLKVWVGIEKQLNAVKGFSVVKMTWWRQAAAAIALLAVGACLGIYFTNKTENKALAETTLQVAPDLKEAEDFYNQKVESKLNQLVSYNPDPSVMADLKQIDDVQEELKKELRNAPSSTREEIVHRLIENYQIKLGILERVLNHIEEHPTDNNKIQQKNEKI